MVLFSINLFRKKRITVRNQYSHYFNDFDMFRIGVTYHTERTEYKFGIIGFQFVLMVFKPN